MLIRRRPSPLAFTNSPALFPPFIIVTDVRAIRITRASASSGSRLSSRYLQPPLARPILVWRSFKGLAASRLRVLARDVTVKRPDPGGSSSLSVCRELPCWISCSSRRCEAVTTCLGSIPTSHLGYLSASGGFLNPAAGCLRPSTSQRAVPGSHAGT